MITNGKPLITINKKKFYKKPEGQYLFREVPYIEFKIILKTSKNN